jgi:glycosyltransferase involved in cell wall biosynthesis
MLPGRGFLRETKGLRGLWVSLQAMNWSTQQVPWFDRIVSVTHEDASIIAQLFPRIPVVTVEVGVDLEAFPYRYSGGDGRTLVYLGNYAHFPNEDAALWFVEEMFPRIREVMPSTRLFLVGSRPTRRICALKGEPGIHVTGTVQDVRPYLERASVFIAPIRKGAGIKGKVLEAMATGIPVVATTCANAGIRARDGEEMRIADSAEAFACAVLDVLHDKEQRMDLSRKGRTLVEERFNWGMLAGKMAEVYEGLIG